MYDSTNNLVTVICSNDTYVKIFSRDEATAIMKPMFVNEESEKDFLYCFDLEIANGEARFVKEKDFTNISYSFICDNLQNKHIKFTLQAHIVKPEIVMSCNNNCVLKSQVERINAIYLAQNKLAMVLIGEYKFTVTMFNNFPVISFINKNKTETNNDVNLTDNVKISVEETINGFKNHISQHSNSKEIDSHLCESVIGYHPEKGWCLINKDGTTIQLIHLLTEFSKDPDKISHRIKLLDDFGILTEIFEFTNRLQISRSIKSMMMSAKNMAAVKNTPNVPL